MNKRFRITMRRRVVVVRQDEKGPFWLEHIIPILCIGLALIVGGIVVLSLTAWGRAAMIWIGLGVGALVTVCLFIAPVRSFRRAPTVVWVGETITAFGWGCMAIWLLAGIPFLFGVGPDDLPEWVSSLPGAGAVVFTAIAGLGMWMLTRGPLPALDRTARSARVMDNTDDADGAQSITVRYFGVDGDEHEAELADLIDDSWRERFASGTTWQVYAFHDSNLADTVVFLTEEHEDVWRDGYKLNGVRLGGESGPLRPAGPGSPFFREGGRWRFQDGEARQTRT